MADQFEGALRAAALDLIKRNLTALIRKARVETDTRATRNRVYMRAYMSVIRADRNASAAAAAAGRAAMAAVDRAGA